MNKSFTKAIKDAVGRGVNLGALLMTLVLVIAMDNTLPEYIDDEDTLSKIFNQTESEVSRIWDETQKSVDTGDVNTMAELLLGHVREIRRKRGMPELDE